MSARGFDAVEEVEGTATTPKRVLDLGLPELYDKLSAAMLSADGFATSKHGSWLRERYREILPNVLPDVLACLQSGESLYPASLDAIKISAVTMGNSPVSMSVVLRGGIPALKVFSAFIRQGDTGLNARDLTVLMGRAAIIAHELAAYWAESWSEARALTTAGSSAADGESLDLVPVAGTVASPALEMLALVAAGKSNHQIAEATDYSLQAVKWHLARVMRSWKVDTRTALVTVALLRGVLTHRTVAPPSHE